MQSGTDSSQQGGGGRAVTTRVKQPHPRYREAREKAHMLETSIESAQKEYADQLSKIIKKLQRQFYSKYGSEIQELEDLEEAIHQIQSSGLKGLKRQLTQLYLMADDDEQHGGGASKEQLETSAKQLYTQYKQQYFPDDSYQRKRDAEARKLQMSIMGSMMPVQRGGGNGVRTYIVPQRSVPGHMSGGGGGGGLLGSIVEDDEVVL